MSTEEARDHLYLLETFVGIFDELGGPIGENQKKFLETLVKRVVELRKRLAGLEPAVRPIASRKHYKVVVTATAEKLGEFVSSNLNEGWTLVAGVSVATTLKPNGVEQCTFAQAMTKGAPPCFDFPETEIQNYASK